ncbi:MAG TPA: LysR family transcriptional regulator, partial [Holophaga sp.]|nr:LysR family transcriptional regulator [Holophaga sp.]
VEAGTVVQAAKRLFVAPTAITMQVAQLEAELGGPLFDRRRRPMALTSLGEFFHPRAKELLDQSRSLEDETRGIAAGNRGWIGIGFTRSTIFSVVPRAVRAFREAFPEVQVELVELLAEHQPAQLRSGRIQVGISRYIGPFEPPADIACELLCEDPFVAALPGGHPLAEGPSVSLPDLAGLPFISYPKDPQSSYAQRVLGLLRAAGLEPRVGYQAIELHTALGLVAAGLGFTLTGASVAEHNRTDVAFVPIRGLDAASRLFAVTRQGEENKLVQAFLRTLAALWA